LIIEFLRFIYCEEIQQLDSDLAIKLWLFSDKILQRDLSDSCIRFLTLNMLQDDTITILDFAREQNILHLNILCMRFIEENADIKNVFELIQFLGKQHRLEFAKDNLKLRDKAFHIIFENYIKIWKKEPEKIQVCQDFLIDNVEIGTISRLAQFISGDIYKQLLHPSEQKVFVKLANAKKRF